MSEAKPLEEQLARTAEDLPAQGVDVGTDLIDISRLRRVIDRGGERLLSHLYTAREVAYCRGKRDPVVHFAGKLAAKEAVFKALRMRWNGAFTWKSIEIDIDSAGAPVVRCQVPEERGVTVSISHEGGFAIAVAMAKRIQRSEKSESC